MDVKKFAIIMTPIILIILIIDIIFFREYFSYLLPVDFFTKRQRKIEKVVEEAERVGVARKIARAKRQEKKVAKKVEKKDKLKEFKKLEREIPVIQTEKWTYPASPLFYFLEVQAEKELANVPNPFRVDFEKEKEEEEEKIISAFQLKAILDSPEGKIANINGKIVKEGDEVFGARVLKIGQKAVWISVGNRIVKLEVSPITLTPQGTIVIEGAKKESPKEGKIIIEIH